MSNEFHVGQRVSYPNKVHKGKTMYAKVTDIASWEEDGEQVVFIEREDIPGSEPSSFRSSELTLEPSEAQLEADRLDDEAVRDWNNQVAYSMGDIETY